jgi:hypothetical protein
MTSAIHRYAGALTAALVLAGCASDAQPPQSDPAEPGATPPTTSEASAARDLSSVGEFRLTMDRIRRADQVADAIHARASGDPTLRRRLDEGSEASWAGIDEMVSAYGSIPEVDREIRRAGFTARDYALTLLSLTMTAAIVTTETEDDPASSEWTSAHNIAVFEQNRPQIEAILARWQSMGWDDEEEAEEEEELMFDWEP